MTYRPKVYTASRLDRWQLWRALTLDPDWSFCQFTSSWPAKIAQGLEETSTPLDFANHWSTDIYEIKNSDFVLLWGRDDGLRGALVECGAAIGFGLKVVTVGLPDSHTWSYHPLVKRCENLIAARLYLFQFTVMVPPVSHRRKEAEHE